MNVARKNAPLAADQPRAALPEERLASLDAFRGLVIVTMVFVNYLAGIKGIPAWAQHRPQELEGYTFVDVVFPAFLFIVGVAIPLSFARRGVWDRPVWLTLVRVFGRAASLIFVGVIMVNTSFYSADDAGLSKNLWFFLAMMCVLVLWSQPRATALSDNSSSPRPARSKPGGMTLARIIAAIVLIGLLAVFRGKNSNDEIVWFQHSWWGILGLIGWAYLVASVIYLLSRGHAAVLAGATGCLLALYIGDRHGALDWLGALKSFVAVGPVLGSTAASVMIGVLAGITFLDRDLSPKRRFSFLLGFAVALFAAGSLLRPLHGINKVAATESYTLVAAAWSCLAFAVVYFLMDIRQWRGWARFAVPVGQNPVLAYVLPGVVSNFLGLLGLQSALWIYGRSWLGALNALAMTLLIVLLTWTFSRLGFRVRL